jgi:FKBP-type peptidyl-prolyl cis-trans isomerase 2
LQETYHSDSAATTHNSKLKFTGINIMKTAQLNDIVTVVYEGFLENGELFESANETGPLEFKIGTGSVMARFEEGVIGMAVDETKELHLEAQDAYGEKRQELVQTIDRSLLKNDLDIRPGMIIGISVDKDDETHQVPATVCDVQGDKVTIDYNHPLAGKKVIFKITLKDIRRNESAIPVVDPSESTSGCGKCH